MNRAYNIPFIAMVALASGLAFAARTDPPSSLPTLGISEPTATLPLHLHETGLFIGESNSTIRPTHIEFTPQYPLWSDGATKRRWLYLPPGTAIDARDSDAWDFPRGTRLWKEFSHGKRIETRYIERLADGSWRYAAYIWNADQRAAVLASARQPTPLQVADAPDGRYLVPSQDDCRACHEAAAVPVLGFSALQLSSARDPLAPHSERTRSDHIDLRALVARGLIRNLPASYISEPPAIPARTPVERAALGYLHGNCGHCHNDMGPLAPLDLSLSHRTSVATASIEHNLSTLMNRPSEFRWDTLEQRIVPGRADQSVLVMRMRARNPLHQMPPLGTQATDATAVALIERWINQQLPTQPEIKR